MGVFKWIKMVLGFEDEVEIPQEEPASNTAAPTHASHVTVVAQPLVSLPMDPEEKELVAVIASCIVGKNQPNANLHIQRITRIQ